MGHPNRAWLTPVIFALPFGIANCSGSDATGGIGGTGGTSMDASATGDATTGDDDAARPIDDAGAPPVATSDAGPPLALDSGTMDAGGPPPIPVPEGGLPSDPRLVDCGKTACSVASTYCCQEPGDGGTIETCQAPNVGCGGPKLGCDEAADCAGGVCCEQIIALGVQGDTTCAATQVCASGSFQMCRTDDECLPGEDGGAFKKCILQTCTNPTTHVVLHVEACAAHTGPGGFFPGPLTGCVAE